jgi:hypothetical protein
MFVSKPNEPCRVVKKVFPDSKEKWKTDKGTARWRKKLVQFSNSIYSEKRIATITTQTAIK